MSKRVRMVVAATCALMAAVACVLYTQHVEGEAERERAQTLKRYGGEVVSLVVATRSLEAGETIVASDVELRDWISSLAPEDAILSLDDALGHEVTVPASANAPLCSLNFRNLSQVEEVPSGHVAVSVPITDKLGVSSAIQVGSRVVAYKVSDTSAELLGASAIVLAVPSSTGSSLERGTLTIAVPSEDVAALLSSSATGDLRLVVPADDVKEFATSKERLTGVAPVKDDSHQDAQNKDAKDKDDASASANNGESSDSAKGEGA